MIKIFPLLAIDKDLSVFNKEAIAWKERGVILQRADDMTEAIEQLLKHDFLMVAINADTINYLPQLSIAHENTQAPIFIITSKYSPKEELLAYEQGADSYSSWNYEDFNVDMALALISRFNERTKRPKNALKTIAYRNILLSPTYYKVFINNTNIKISKMEFDILYYLILNRGRVISYQQLYKKFWHGEFDEVDPNILYSEIKRLRRKLKKASSHYEYIETIRGVGYRFHNEII